MVALDTVDSATNTLAPRRSAQINLDIIRDLVDDIVLVSDDEMRRACQWLWLWFEMGQAVELAGGRRRGNPNRPHLGKRRSNRRRRGLRQWYRWGHVGRG